MSKERPILFNGEMVRAVLDGRKTQTRRVCKPQEKFQHYEEFRSGDCFQILMDGYHSGGGERITRSMFAKKFCPYGAPGDRLWVRETWHKGEGGSVRYRADTRFPELGPRKWETWKPSIHMPRWASRINLEITNVRVERVQDISEEDAIAEGIVEWDQGPLLNRYGLREWNPDQRVVLATGAFMRLWNSINKKRGFGWDVNPWVWVVEFQRIEQEGR